MRMLTSDTRVLSPLYAEPGQITVLPATLENISSIFLDPGLEDRKTRS